MRATKPKLYHGSQPKATLLQRSRFLRQTATDAEQVLWWMLRNRQIAGAKFRRQHQHGRYVLDFFWNGGNLAVEVDGGQHYSTNGMLADAARTRYLQDRGVKVMRFANIEVLQQTDAVLQSIWEAVVALTPTLSQGEREKSMEPRVGVGEPHRLEGLGLVSSNLVNKA